MQYLTAQQEVLRSIYLDKKNFESHAPERDDDCEPDLRDTQIIDLRRARDADFVQLPRGETIEVQCSALNELPIMLSRYRFRIVNDGELRLVSADGNRFELGIGKNVVGRYGGNKVALDPGYRDISRKHLVVERVDEHTLRLTDLSAHVTFVPATVLQISRQ